MTTINVLNCFTGGDTIKRKETDNTEDTEEEPLEVDYDSVQLTYLYQAIQDKAFMAAIDFLESGQPEVADEIRTWVTRYEEDKPNKIRWSHLPLHAALLFKAPTRVIELLVEKYPKGVRCTNDQQMLPLHLAFRYGASDAVYHLLLKEFPDAIKSGDFKGRLPLDFAKEGENWKKGEIINMYVDNAKADVIKTKHDEALRSMQDTLEEKTHDIQELEKSKQELAEEAERAKAEVEALQKELEALKTKANNKVASKKTRTPTSGRWRETRSGDKPIKKRGFFKKSKA